MDSCWQSSHPPDRRAPALPPRARPLRTSLPCSTSPVGGFGGVSGHVGTLRTSEAMLRMSAEHYNIACGCSIYSFVTTFPRRFQSRQSGRRNARHDTKQVPPSGLWWMSCCRRRRQIAGKPGSPRGASAAQKGQKHGKTQHESDDQGKTRIYNRVQF